MPSKLFAPGRLLACDVVELRLDLWRRKSRWLSYAQAIEAAGQPVIITIRLGAEGGKWTNPDEERLPQLTQALKNLSAVDVELSSSLVPTVARMAKRLGKVCILSYHDFEGTPPLAVLAAIVAKSQAKASVVKIVTRVQSAADLQCLRELLAGPWKVPLCVMGMGPLGARSRAAFAALGSCLTYGYLDQAVAPGQKSSASLVRQLKKMLPAYRAERAKLKKYRASVSTTSSKA